MDINNYFARVEPLLGDSYWRNRHDHPTATYRLMCGPEGLPPDVDIIATVSQMRAAWLRALDALYHARFQRDSRTDSLFGCVMMFEEWKTIPKRDRRFRPDRPWANIPPREYAPRSRDWCEIAVRVLETFDPHTDPIIVTDWVQETFSREREEAISLAFTIVSNHWSHFRAPVGAFRQPA